MQLLKRLCALRHILTAQGVARKRINDDLTFGQAQLAQKVTGKCDAAGIQIQAVGQLQPDNGQRDGYSYPCLQHQMNEAVVGVVVIVDVTLEAELMEEKLIENPRALYWIGIG